MSTVEINVETQHGIATRAWDEWTLTASMRSDGSFYDWLHAERGGQRLDIDDFARLAPDVDLAKLESEAVEKFADAQDADPPWVKRLDRAREQWKARVEERS